MVRLSPLNWHSAHVSVFFNGWWAELRVRCSLLELFFNSRERERPGSTLCVCVCMCNESGRGPLRRRACECIGAAPESSAVDELLLEGFCSGFHQRKALYRSHPVEMAESRKERKRRGEKKNLQMSYLWGWFIIKDFKPLSFGWDTAVMWKYVLSRNEPKWP